MKKIKIVQIIGFVLVLVYFLLIISELIVGYLKDFRELTFSILLVIVSINLLFKGVFLKSQSTLWFANVLILYAILMIVFNLLNIEYNNYIYIYILLPIISSIINIVIFHNLIYIKVIILNISLVVPFILYKFIKLDFYLYFIIGTISVLLGIIMCRFFKMKREKV